MPIANATSDEIAQVLAIINQNNYTSQWNNQVAAVNSGISSATIYAAFDSNPIWKAPDGSGFFRDFQYRWLDGAHTTTGYVWVWADAPQPSTSTPAPIPVAAVVVPPKVVIPPIASTVYAPIPIDLGLIRATSVSQMYTITPNTFQNNIMYLIGKSGSIFSQDYAFSNVTTNADLLVTVRVPTYITSNTTSVTVAAGKQSTISVNFNIDGAMSKFMTDKQTKFNDQLEWAVTPLNLTGPVYIHNPNPSKTTVTTGSTPLSPPPPFVPPATLSVAPAASAPPIHASTPFISVRAG